MKQTRCVPGRYQQQPGRRPVEGQVAEGDGRWATDFDVVGVEVIDEDVYGTGGDHGIRNAGPGMG